MLISILKPCVNSARVPESVLIKKAVYVLKHRRLLTSVKSERYSSLAAYRAWTLFEDTRCSRDIGAPLYLIPPIAANQSVWSLLRGKIEIRALD